MRQIDNPSWITLATNSLSSNDQHLIQLDASHLAQAHFKDLDQIRIATTLLSQLGLGARLHWQNLNHRSLVPNNVGFPKYEIGDYPNDPTLHYNNKNHAITANYAWLLSCVAIGNPNLLLRWESVYGTSPKTMSGNVFFFLGGIEELDHAVKDKKFGISFLPDYLKSETKYYASNHEFTSLGWMLYYAYLFSLPHAVTTRMEHLMNKAVKYRENKEIKLIPKNPNQPKIRRHK